MRTKAQRAAEARYDKKRPAPVCSRYSEEELEQLDAKRLPGESRGQTQKRLTLITLTCPIGIFQKQNGAMDRKRPSSSPCTGLKMNKNKDQRGGPREGAGRPRFESEPQKRRNITLSDRLADKARRLGKGSISHGIRNALEKAK